MPHAPEVRERARRLIFDDGYPIAEAARTVGVSRKTVGIWFPDAPRMDRKERSEWANLCKHQRVRLGL
jgi:transposase-like protein